MITLRSGKEMYMLWNPTTKLNLTSPDTYVKKVVSFNSTFPSTDKEVSPMDLIDASFYSPKPMVLPYPLFRPRHFRITSSNTLERPYRAIIPLIRYRLFQK